MSYICELCHEVQGIGERPTTIVVETRDREYPNPINPEEPFLGWEVVKEVKMCHPCIEAFDQS